MLLACGDGPIDAAHLDTTGAAQEGPTHADADGTLREIERAFIERVFEEEEHNVERASRRLGIARSTFYHKLRLYGLTFVK